MIGQPIGMAVGWDNDYAMIKCRISADLIKSLKKDSFGIRCVGVLTAPEHNVRERGYRMGLRSE